MSINLQEKMAPYLAFSELTKRVYIVHGGKKTDVTDWVDKYAQQKCRFWDKLIKQAEKAETKTEEK